MGPLASLAHAAVNRRPRPRQGAFSLGCPDMGAALRDPVTADWPLLVATDLKSEVVSQFERGQFLGHIA